jgi:DnaA regulatory inactivator Hda
MPPGQLTLDLGHRPALGREDFLVSPGNTAAVTWIDRWPAWPGHALALHGPAGCGKSHLAQVFALRAKALVIGAAALRPESIAELLDAYPAVVAEDCETIFDEAALLHLFNGMKEKGGHLLLTGREAPARWTVALPDLRSRVAAVTAVGISMPSDEMFEAVLVKLFADRQLAVAPDVIGYLVRHMDRSFSAARQIVAQADHEALASKRAVTIPLVKSLLGKE